MALLVQKFVGNLFKTKKKKPEGEGNGLSGRAPKKITFFAASLSKHTKGQRRVCLNYARLTFKRFFVSFSGTNKGLKANFARVKQLLTITNAPCEKYFSLQFYMIPFANNNNTYIKTICLRACCILPACFNH